MASYLLLLLVVLLAWSARGATNDCQNCICFTSEPKNMLKCNPYTANYLAISCRVRVSPLSVPVMIKWFSSTGQAPLANSSNIIIQSVTNPTTGSVISRIRIKNIASAQYWCRAYYNNIMANYTSTKLGVEDMSSYGRNDPCNETAQSMDIMKCEDLVEANLPSTSTATSTPVMTALPGPSRTSSPSPDSSEGGAELTSTIVGRTSVGVVARTTQVVAHSSTANITPTLGAVNLPQPYQTWLYVVVGLTVVFGMLIIILTIICVGLCLLKARTNQVDTLDDERKVTSGHSTPSHNGRLTATVTTLQTDFMGKMGNIPVTNAIYNTLEQDYEDLDEDDGTDGDQDSELPQPQPQPQRGNPPPPPPCKPRYYQQSSQPQPHYSALSGVATRPAVSHSQDPALTGYGKLDHSKPRKNFYPTKESPLLSGYRKLEHLTQGSGSSTLPQVLIQEDYANIEPCHVRCSSLPDNENPMVVVNAPSPTKPTAKGYRNFAVIQEHEEAQRKSSEVYHKLENVTADHEHSDQFTTGTLGAGEGQEYDFLHDSYPEESYDNLEGIVGNSNEVGAPIKALGLLTKDPIGEQLSMDSSHSGDFTGPFILPHMLQFGIPPEADNHMYTSLEISNIEPDQQYMVPATKHKRGHK